MLNGCCEHPVIGKAQEFTQGHRYWRLLFLFSLPPLAQSWASRLRVVGDRHCLLHCRSDKWHKNLRTACDSPGGCRTSSPLRFSCTPQLEGCLESETTSIPCEWVFGIYVAYRKVVGD